MPPSVRNRRLGMVSPRRGLGKQSRRIPSDGGQGLYMPFFNTLRPAGQGIGRGLRERVPDLAQRGGQMHGHAQAVGAFLQGYLVQGA